MCNTAARLTLTEKVTRHRQYPRCWQNQTARHKPDPLQVSNRAEAKVLMHAAS